MTDSISPQTAPVLRRRRWLVGAFAGAAALGGASFAWRRSTSNEAAESIYPGFWQLTFEAPDGTLVQMRHLRGKNLLINFWATWCPPCIDELPLLNRFYEANSAKGWQVLGLAVDQATPVRRFLAQTPVTFPVAMGGLPGIEISRELGNAGGGLPFTTVIGSNGTVQHRKIGQVSVEDLRVWAASA